MGTLLTAGNAVVIYLVSCMSVALYYVPTPQHRWNAFVLGMLFFNFLNIFIACCEISLGWNVKLIQTTYQKKKLELAEAKTSPKKKVWNLVMDFFTYPITSIPLIMKHLPIQMWSTYALYDPSYQNNESFGFFIDVGNGYTTILPCLLFIITICKPDYIADKLGGGQDNNMAHIIFACIIVASYWQIAYGTIIYFSAFIYHKRYCGHALWELTAFVYIMNAIWIVFPFWGIYGCIQILKAGSLQCLLQVNDDKIFLSNYNIF